MLVICERGLSLGDVVEEYFPRRIVYLIPSRVVCRIERLSWTRLDLHVPPASGVWTCGGIAERLVGATPDRCPSTLCIQATDRVSTMLGSGRYLERDASLGQVRARSTGKYRAPAEALVERTRRSAVSGQRSMVNGQWSMVNGQ